jgi:inorganic triphosphatase YgiF
LEIAIEIAIDALSLHAGSLKTEVSKSEVEKLALLNI